MDPGGVYVKGRGTQPTVGHEFVCIPEVAMAVIAADL